MYSPGKKQRCAPNEWQASFDGYSFGCVSDPPLPFGNDMLDFPAWQVGSVEFNNLFATHRPGTLEESLFGIQEAGEFQPFLVPDSLQKASEMRVETPQHTPADECSASTEHPFPKTSAIQKAEEGELHTAVCGSNKVQEGTFSIWVASPATPRKDGKEVPTPWAPKKQPAPQLVQALCSNSLEDVKAALADDPEAALMPIWEYDSDPPLCFAVRQLCSPGVVEFLLEAGAQVNAVDSQGLTPLHLLGLTQDVPVQHLVPVMPPLATCSDIAQLSAIYESKSDERRLALADLLVQAGAVGKVPAGPALCQTPPQTPRGGRPENLTPCAPKKEAAPCLLQAFCSDSLEKVRAVIASDPEAAWTPLWEQDAEPPLCCAARHACSPQIVELLLEAGADVNAVDSKGRTPLALLRLAESRPAQTDLVPPLPFLAPQPDYEELLSSSQRKVKERCSAIAKLLTQAGAVDEEQEVSPVVYATPPQTPRKGFCKSSTPAAPRKPTAPRMLDALCSDSFEEVKAVLAGDPDAAWIPFWEQDAEPPLCCAVRHACSPRIVELLLEAGADVDAVDSKGLTPLALLRLSENGLAQIGLVPPLSFLAPHSDYEELLANSQRGGKEWRSAVAILLAQAGAIDEEQEVSLVVYATPPQTPRKDLCKQSTPGAPKKPTAPRMLDALCPDSVEEMRAVLKDDFDAAWEPFLDHDSELPLCYAAQCLCDPTIVELLLGAGAEVNAVGSKGETPLSLMGSAERQSVQHLVPPLPFLATHAEAGEQLVVHETRANEWRDAIARILTDAGAIEKRQEVTSALSETPPQTPRKACRETGTPSAPKKPIAPRMFHAICSDSSERVKAVLAEDPEAAWMPFWDYDAETPLCYAARRLCDPQIVEVLLRAGAQVNVADIEGFTPLDLSRMTDGAPAHHLIPPLPSLARGPDPVDADTEEDYNAQVEERRSTIADMLLQAGAVEKLRDAAAQL